MIRIFMLLICILILTSCSKAEVVQQELPTHEELLVPEEPVSEPISVSPLATEDFLEPFDKYSWEREYKPEYVMIHFTSAIMLSKDDPYNIETVRKIFIDNEISINYIIDRDGKIYCYIPEYRAAWHAGKGSFGGIEKLTNAMNRYSIGIELVAMGSEKDMSVYMSAEEYATIDKELIGFTDKQYESLSYLVSDICERNDIPLDREHIIGHCEYKKEKTDPGELFDWERIRVDWQ